LLSLAPCISNQFPCVGWTAGPRRDGFADGVVLWIGVGSSNNYAYLVIDDKTKDAVIIDPAHPEE
jgi:hypothetical protein